MKTNIRGQRGMTFIGLLVVLSLIAFFTLLVLRLFPPYMENFSVSSSVKSLQQEVGIASKSPAVIKDLLKKRLDVNDVKNVKPEHVKITRVKDGLLRVEVVYDVRVPIAGNVDAIVSFSEAVELRNQ